MLNLGSLQQLYPSELRHFLRCWIDNPLAVGAVAPSGRALAKLITAELGPGHLVMELGPGTGAFTRMIIERGVAPRDLYLLERSPRFAKRLEKEFADATVICRDATEPSPELEALRGRVDAVISGLPLMLFGATQRRAVLERCFELLCETGALYQFTYGARCPVGRRMLAAAGLEAKRVGIAALNVPPAFVYRIVRGKRAAKPVAAAAAQGS